MVGKKQQQKKHDRHNSVKNMDEVWQVVNFNVYEMG
jgi:hypothetical protein